MHSNIKYVHSTIKRILKRKKLSGIVALAFLVSGYFVYGKIAGNDGIVRYVTAEVQKGALIVSLSGSGQVLASNQVDVKPKASGEINGVYIKQGQEVVAGALLASIDARDAARAVRDAETSLETAKLELDKLLEPTDELTVLQAENSLRQAHESKQKAEDSLIKAYDDGFNTVSNVFLDLPDVMSGLQEIIYGSALGGNGQWNIDFYTNAVQIYDASVFQFKDDVYAKYNNSRQAYDKNLADYKSISRYSDKEGIEKMIYQTYDTTKLIADAVKSANNLIQFYQDKLIERNLKPLALSDTHISGLGAFTGKTNSHLLNLLSAGRSLKDSGDAIVSAERSIAEKALSLAKTKKEPDELDLRSRKITIRQREDALLAAKQTLADHYARAPFGGIVAKVNAKKGDSASSGTALAILVTKQKIAEISLNEIDVSKVKLDQKATLAFDAIPELTITGVVAEIDTIGTVSQGVVTYTVKIAFDTQDERVKPSMSVGASIVIDAKPDVLLVPNSAAKTQNGATYVEVPGDQEAVSGTNASMAGAIFKYPLIRRSVEIGLSNDEFTEVVSGLKEGDLIVTRTIQPNLSQPAGQTQNRSLFQVPGSGGGGARGGGGFR